jgi:glycosyltransferase involved in cell wall biosynthesis
VSASEDASKHLRVAVVAPPWISIPPDGYGGIEAMVFWLIEGLVHRGHEVTLIGAGDCRTSAARFLQTYEEPPMARMGTPFPEVVHALQADEHLAELDLDVVHDHSMGGPLTARARRVPTVLTAHGPVVGELGECYRLLSRHHPMVAISESQRAKGPHLPWAATVYNAIPVDEYPFETDKDDFVLFLGRISAEKGPDLAIKAARAAGRRIVVAAKCNEPAEHAYFEERVRPLLGPDAEWYGHATTEEKKKLLAKASALVFPIQWDEPFGIVMVEAMACGTPVVALRRGSVPEIVEHGETGLICDDPAELPAALHRVHELDPVLCRRRVEDRFDAQSMAESYERLYRAITRVDVAPARAS